MRTGTIRNVGAEQLEVGGRVIRYRRWGAGPSVIALALHGGKGGDRLLEALPPGFRMIAPWTDVGGADVGWLPDLIDGLGLDRPALVADGSLAAEVLGLLLRDPLHVGPVALVLQEPTGSPAGVPAAALLDTVAHPVLFLPLSDTASTEPVVARLAAFLREGR